MSPLSIAISPCPNDTFVFEHFIKKQKNVVDYFDIQELNEWALQKKYDLIKVSFGILPNVLNDYQLLRVGSALGMGNGPLLIAKKNFHLNDIKHLQIASPGKFTTAQTLFNYFFPDTKNINYSIFSNIENLVLNNQADIGIIIHEQRFTYEQKGLIKILDLGEQWEKKFKLPIPLGCLLIKKSLPQHEKINIQNELQNSILEANKHLPAISPFIKQSAQEMDNEVILKHIQLYVNEHTFYLSTPALNAIQTLIKTMHPNFIFPEKWTV